MTPDITHISDNSDYLYRNNVIYYFKNSTMSKTKLKNEIKKTILDIIHSYVIGLSHNRVITTYVITDYPKMYIRKIGSDILADFSKIMFNKKYKDVVHSSDSKYNKSVITSLIETTNECTPLNTIVVETHCSTHDIGYHTRKICNNCVEVCRLSISDDHLFNVILLNKIYSIPLIYFTLLDGAIDNILCDSVQTYMDNIPADGITTPTIVMVKSLVNKKMTLYKIAQSVDKCDTNNIYSELMKKIHMFDNTMYKIINKFTTDNNDAIKLEADISKSLNSINNDPDELCDTDTDINSQEIFKSFISMMGWVDELESRSCIGLAMSAIVKSTPRGIGFTITSVPNTCVSILDFLELLTNESSIDINNICISNNPYNNDIINIVIPLYINKTHWEVSKNYLNIVSNIISYGYPFTRDTNYYRLYFSLFVDYISSMFNNSRDISENEIILFFAYWRTTIEIRCMLNINCEKIFMGNHDTNYKYFDYRSLMGQLLVTIPMEHAEKYFGRTIDNMIKSCVSNTAYYNTSDYFSDIVHLIQFFTLIYNNNVVMSELEQMSNNNSVISADCINTVKHIITEYKPVKHTYLHLDIINKHMKNTMPNYDAHQVISDTSMTINVYTPSHDNYGDDFSGTELDYHNENIQSINHQVDNYGM